MSGIRAEFSLGDDDLEDLNVLVDKVRAGVSSLFQERSICEMIGIECGALDAIGKVELLNKINEMKFGSKFENEIVEPGNPILLQTEESSELIKAACIFEVLGFEQLAKNMRRFYAEMLIETMMEEVRQEANAKKVISDANRKKALRPRHKLYSEVMSVIAATWKKYPRASKTGLLEALTHHYYEKVTRNAINEWIKNSGLIPPKPEKYSDFELVFPSLAS